MSFRCSEIHDKWGFGTYDSEGGIFFSVLKMRKSCELVQKVKHFVRNILF